MLVIIEPKKSSQNLLRIKMKLKISNAEATCRGKHHYENHIEPWLIGGDFTTFLSIEEHVGLSTPSLSSLEDFNDCLSYCSLIDLPYEGPMYTWTSGRGLGIAKCRLDGMLCSESFNRVFPNLRVRHLPRLTSDHASLLL